jgi:GNAT superfamily N-acetyltransferase
MPHSRPRTARSDDVPSLVALMTEFYAEAGFALPAEPAARAFATLLADERLGRVWLLEIDSAPVGYLVLTLCYAMEYGGLRGVVDDLFVRAEHRGKGLAGAGLEEVRRSCAELGVRALQVEVGAENDTARRLYERAGLRESGHLLLTLPLAPPLHEQRIDGSTGGRAG